MEAELEPRVKPLSYKVKAMSRESPSQKASHVLDTDLRNHWSAGTNTKEWILLELDEPCLLSHIRIYNKSVLEWEISVGLRYKPETFAKVRPRCEAPRRDMTYPMNYTPCRYVRISCMRGNPIAIFFIELIGIPVRGLEPEFQSVANYLVPHIVSRKQDTADMHLQLLQDVTSRLSRFLPHLEADLNSFQEAAEPTVHFLAMLAGPFYPILHIVNERETARSAVGISDYEVSKTSIPSTPLMVSSNFEPRRSRNTPSVFVSMSNHVVFRPDAIFILLRKAYKDSYLGNLCRMVSRILIKLMEPMDAREASNPAIDNASSVADETPKANCCGLITLTDYSDLFGVEFQVPDYAWDPSYLNVLDTAAVEEGLLHVLYASASQPLHCRKLAENASDFWLALPLVQALLPALRPNVSISYQIDETFALWKQPFVQNALSQIVATSSSLVYRPLLRSCAGYLASFSPSHAKAACVLIDLCSGVLAPWIAQVIAKVDLAVELLEDLLGLIQGSRLSLPRARAALKYVVLALSGHMDDIMAKYKDAKHRILFLVEMLEPFLDPALTPLKGMIAFGNVSSIFAENQEKNCAIALNVIRTAIRKSSVLPSLEAEWRRGVVAPSVLLSVLDAQMQLPSDIDHRKFSSSENVEPQSSVALHSSCCNGGASSRSNNLDNGDSKVDDIDINVKVDVAEDASLLFAPSELNKIPLSYGASVEIRNSDASCSNVPLEVNNVVHKHLSSQFPESVRLDARQGVEFYNVLADYSQLMNYRDCELRAAEFKRLALDLNADSEITLEGHDVVIDALLLAAECYINPCFTRSFKDIIPGEREIHTKRSQENLGVSDLERFFKQKNNDLKLLTDIERKRDRVVLEILIEAAELDRKYHQVEWEETAGLYGEADEEFVDLSEGDIISADAVTLVRLNQSLLCNFLIRRLQSGSHGEQRSLHEILMWCLLFLLHSATRLFCSPEHVVDIILNFAESFNMQLKSFADQFKEGNSMNHCKLHEVQRCWILLERIVIASSGSDEPTESSINIRNGFRFSNLVPPSAWLQKIPIFSSSAFPLVRYFGWMAVARNAKQYLKERLHLVSDLSQLTYLLSIFSDDLCLVDSITGQKDMNKETKEFSVHNDINVDDRGRRYSLPDRLQSFHAIYPCISKFFPNLKKEFEAFGQTILEAVGLQLKFLSSAIVPDLMCWFSNLCSWPFVQNENLRHLFQNKSDYFKGFIGKNAKAVILYILEAIVVEHMEAMVPEMPRVVQALVSLCRSSYCDVSFLDSVLRLLKPIIAYSLGKASEENLFVDDSCDNLESLCLAGLFNNLRFDDENQDSPIEKGKCPALTIFILTSIFGDLSFHRKAEVLKSTISWAEFSSFEASISFYDYIIAYQVLMENCKDLLTGSARAWGILPLEGLTYSDSSNCVIDDFSKSFLNEMYKPCSPSDMPEKHPDDKNSVADVSQKGFQLTLEEINSFSKDLEALILKLYPTIEQCWRIHPRLAKKLAITSAECFIYSRCLCLIAEKASTSLDTDKLFPRDFVDEFPSFWRTSLEGLAQMILLLQEKHCWEVAFVLLDSLLGAPQFFNLDTVIGDISLAVKNFATTSPNISWRLQSDKLVSMLFTRGIRNLSQLEGPLVDLFCTMLAHPEPEQRYIALKHLGRLAGQDVDGGNFSVLLTTEIIVAASDLVPSDSELILSPLVSGTWDQVALIASSDTSLLLRTHATALLISYIPFADRGRLQSFLAAADSILQCLTTLSQPTCGGPLTQFSLALIASVCLYSQAEDISLIPESIWKNIETFATSRNDVYCTSLEKKACEALYRLKTEGDEAKQVLKEVLSSNSPRQQIPDFVNTRESILQVIGNLTSSQSYFDFFAKEVDHKITELEEAEVEMELLQREHPVSNSSFDMKDWRQLPFLSSYARDDKRLQEIKDEIRSIEKAKLREEVVARRQQRLLVRRARQQLLEEAAQREAELIQKLDRERKNEVERELERQQLLELERAKTRDLQHNLDMEKEKQAQRELQRELEQVESGLRPSRREFPSSGHRSRDRYRDRESTEGGLKTTSHTVQSDTSSPSMGNMPTVVLSGNRSFSGQLPTILQSRERSDECNSSYEENFDGSRDVGDTGSMGDPDMDGQPMSFAQRGRGGKSRQVIERRERDARREGKWERKH